MLGHRPYDFLVVETFRTAVTRSRATLMKQKIIGFDQDGDKDWRAKLACGHYQHVRHNPPLTSREWVLDEKGREEKIGAELECRKCIETAPPDFDI